MRTSLLLSFSMLISSLYSQALISGNVTNYSELALVGQEILFESLKTKKQYRVMSNEEGTFCLALPFEDKYQIIIAGFNEETDYTSFEIPALKEGQSGMDFTIDIKIDPPKEFILNNVYFDSGKSSSNKSSYKELDKLFEYLSLRKDERIEIGGHTDNIGGSQANLKLSQERADRIKEHLISKGIAPSRLEAQGYGADEPIASNDTAEGRKLNRRTTVRVL